MNQHGAEDGSWWARNHWWWFPIGFSLCVGSGVTLGQLLGGDDTWTVTSLLVATGTPLVILLPLSWFRRRRGVRHS